MQFMVFVYQCRTALAPTSFQHQNAQHRRQLTPSAPASSHIHTHRRKIHEHHQTAPQNPSTRSSAPTTPQTAAKPHPTATRNFFLGHNTHNLVRSQNMDQPCPCIPVARRDLERTAGPKRPTGLNDTPAQTCCADAQRTEHTSGGKPSARLLDGFTSLRPTLRAYDTQKPGSGA